MTSQLSPVSCISRLTSGGPPRAALGCTVPKERVIPLVSPISRISWLSSGGLLRAGFFTFVAVPIGDYPFNGRFWVMTEIDE